MVGRRLLACPEGHEGSLGFTLPGKCYNCPEYLLRGRPAICLTGLKATWDAKAQTEPRNLGGDTKTSNWYDIRTLVDEGLEAAAGAIEGMIAHFTKFVKHSLENMFRNGVIKTAEAFLKKKMTHFLESCDLLIESSRCLIGKEKDGCASSEKGAKDNKPIWVSDIMELEVSLPQQLCA